jgi:branched-chain amino acid transport system ATP-binding protein
MLEVKGVDVFYGDVQVLWDVSFEVKKGEIVARSRTKASRCTRAPRTTS